MLSITVENTRSIFTPSFYCHYDLILRLLTSDALLCLVYFLNFPYIDIIVSITQFISRSTSSRDPLQHSQLEHSAHIGAYADTLAMSQCLAIMELDMRCAGVIAGWQVVG